MKYINKEDVKDEIEMLGLGLISKLSSINFLARKNIGIDGLIHIQSKMNELEAAIWSLLPLAIGDDLPVYEDQIKHATQLFNSFIKASKAMREINT